MVKYFLHSHPIRDHVIMFMLQKANKWSTKPTKQRIEWVPVHFIWEDTSKEKSEKSRWVFNTSNVQRRSGNTSSYKVLKWINAWFRGKHNSIKNKKVFITYDSIFRISWNNEIYLTSGIFTSLIDNNKLFQSNAYEKSY